MITFLLILSVLIGVFSGGFFSNNEKIARKILILSAGFLITMCVVEIFPQVYHIEDENIGFWIIGGVLLQMFLESLTKGFEHGHFHKNCDCHILPTGLVLGMFIHAFIEGIPLAKEDEIASPFLLGILFHNIPISFVLGSFLLSEKKNKVQSWFIIILFALASPLGMMLGEFISPVWQVYFLAITGGIFLHISSVIIFESNKNHKMDWEKMILVVLGILLALLVHFLHDHSHHHHHH